MKTNEGQLFCAVLVGIHSIHMLPSLEGRVECLDTQCSAGTLSGDVSAAPNGRKVHLGTPSAFLASKRPNLCPSKYLTRTALARV